MTHIPKTVYKIQLCKFN